MEDRIARHEAIRRLILSRRIDSQEMLLNLLEKEGYAVTQATLSRDLRHLRVVKAANGLDGYRYTLLEPEQESQPREVLIHDFIRGFLSIDFSGNLGVIKTLPGHAPSVAAALDNLRIDEILGTIAGDDTVLVIPRDGTERSEIIRSLEAVIPAMKE